MVLKVTNSIGQDALVFSSDNQVPNGMLVKKASSLTIMKSLVSSAPVNFVAVDKSTNARLYLNNLGKLLVKSSHSQDDVTQVTLTTSGKCFHSQWSMTCVTYCSCLPRKVLTHSSDSVTPSSFLCCHALAEHFFKSWFMFCCLFL